MFRIDSQGTSATLPTPAAVGPTVGYFTKGDPGNAILPTVVSDDWLNMTQEEILNVILAAGLTPSKTTYTQLRDAILELQAGAAVELAVGNNQSNQNLTGFSFDGTLYKAVELDYAIYRKTDTPIEVACKGRKLMLYKPVTNTWDLIDSDEYGDDCGVTFDISQATTIGQLRYSSSNLAGANHVGEIRLIKKLFKE